MIEKAEGLVMSLSAFYFLVTATCWVVISRYLYNQPYSTFNVNSFENGGIQTLASQH